MYSLTLEGRLHQGAADERLRTGELSARLLTAIANAPNLLTDAQWLQDISREMIESDGVAVYRSGEVFASGAAPPDETVRALARRLALASPSRVFDTDHLASLQDDEAAGADRAAGMLAIPISRSPRDYVMLFRREQIHEVKWSGDPAKVALQTEQGLRLSPRKSFAAYASIIRGKRRPFSSQDRQTGEAVRQAMIEVNLRFSESAGDAQKQAAQRQELLIAELNHRVRNILSLIRGLIRQGEKSATGVTDFVGALNGRVQALARAHDQITRQNWGPAALATLFEDEIAAQSGNGTERLALFGPTVLLHPQAISTMALVVHELVTNSVKYGALSTVGRIHVTIEPTAGEGVWVRWREKGGPKVAAPERRGFGSVIVERTVPFDLQGKADIRYAPDGLEADFFIPQAHVAFASTTPAAAPSHGDIGSEPIPLPSRPLQGLRALLVEDNMLIALDAEEMLTELGAASVVSVSTLEAAEAATANTGFDFAMLDINVGPGTSFDFARRWARAGLPYIFASGYGDQFALDSDHSGSIVIQKPYERDHLRRAILHVMPERVSTIS
jgi:light-regulated signal transduction histidine kinase (bacteriophytochrome)